jgi:hypothetical protein
MLFCIRLKSSVQKCDSLVIIYHKTKEDKYEYLSSTTQPLIRSHSHTQTQTLHTLSLSLSFLMHYHISGSGLVAAQGLEVGHGIFAPFSTFRSLYHQQGMRRNTN